MKKTIKLLFAQQDREQVSPITEALREKGLRVAEGAARRDELVLAVLSAAFYADEASVETLMSLLAAGTQKVLPLQLDGAEIPETLKNALYARNIIPAVGRDAAHTAERILDALPRKKSRLPRLLAVGAAALLLAAGLFVWRSLTARGVLPAMGRSENLTVTIPDGLTREDLEQIVDVVIVGDQVAFFTEEAAREERFSTEGDVPRVLPALPGWEHFASLDEWNGVHWYSNENGSEMELCRYDDLRFISLMSNLRHLTLVLTEAPREALPDLTKAAALEEVSILSCGIGSVDWLAGSSVRKLSVRFCPVTDFSVLSACEALESLIVDMYDNPVQTDFSAFAPPELRSLWLWHANPGGALDLSALAGSKMLNTVTFGDLPLSDLSCLSASQELSELDLYEMNALSALSGLEGLPLHSLRIFNCEALRDVSAAGTLSQLEQLELESDPVLRDLSPLSGCTELRRFYVWGMNQIRDVSFLSSLHKLNSLDLFDVDIPNLDFLEVMPQNGEFRFSFSGDIRDYSGLAAISRYDYLHLNVHSRYNERGDLGAVLPYLEGAEVKGLHLHECTNFSLSDLPRVTENLEIWYGDLSDLSTMPDMEITRLQLYDLQYLTSLDGIENLKSFRRSGALTLEITGCPRLSDWSAIENASLAHLTLEGVYSLPRFDGVGVGTLRLESIEGLRDLGVLSALSDGHDYNDILLRGLGELYDISVLGRLHIRYLEAPPQVADQAQALQDEGAVEDYEIVYPEGSWQPYDGQTKLLSLDELDTLPQLLLERVESLCLAGAALVDPEREDVIWQWEEGVEQPVFYTVERDAQDATAHACGAGELEDLRRLSSLRGLRELRLYAQSAETLDGIQSLGALEELCVVYCPALHDASAAFTLQELRRLSLEGCPVESIQGVQNLGGLRELDLKDTRVADLKVLLSLPGLEYVRVSADMAEAIASLDGQEYAFEFEIVGG